MLEWNTISLLLKHMEWADAKVWMSVLVTSSADNDSSIKKILYHIHAVQRAFFYIWTKQPLEFPKETDFPKLIEIAKWGCKYHTKIDEYLKTFDEDDLNQSLDIPWANKLEEIIGKKPVNPSLVETMLQVTIHSAYHRGQVNKRLRDLGGEPQLIDFIVWVWKGKPKADWKI